VKLESVITGIEQDSQLIANENLDSADPWRLLQCDQFKTYFQEIERKKEIESIIDICYVYVLSNRQRR
jgi:hypothetical protein